MNYLAHAVLSFNRPEILAGNMTSDFIKGKKKFDYPAGIQQGIALHRAIDEFTDSHPVTAEAKQYFRPAYRLYSGAFIDIVYDHFLANDAHEFPNHEVLRKFSETTYQHLLAFGDNLAPEFRSMLPYMIRYDWLYNYRHRTGIQQSFGGLVRRSKYLEESHTAFMLFEHHYAVLQNCYNNFFPLLKHFAQEHLQLLQQE